MPMPWGSGASIPPPTRFRLLTEESGLQGGVASSAPSWGSRTPGARAHPCPQANPPGAPWCASLAPRSCCVPGAGASSPSPPCLAPYSFLTPQQAQVPAPLHWGGT